MATQFFKNADDLAPVLQEYAKTLLESGLKTSKKATLVVPYDVYTSMYAIVDACDKEVAFFVNIEKIKSGLYKLHLINGYASVPPQEVTGATVNIDQQKYVKWMSDNIGLFRRMNCHVHSHVHMFTNPSGTDMDFRDDDCATVQSGVRAYLILNKERSMTAEIRDFDDNIFYTDSDITCKVYTIPDDVCSWAKSQVDKQVSAPKPTPVTKWLNTSSSRAFDTNSLKYDEDGFSYYDWIRS